MKNKFMSANFRRFRLPFIYFIVCLILPPLASGQAVPYSRIYPSSRQDVDESLNELQAYAGQRLPTVAGFVAEGDPPLDRYDHAFYQFSIELMIEPPDATMVRVTAKITAWYADPDPSKSGYRVLPSNGRLELDLLDRLTEMLGKHSPAAVLSTDVELPKPSINYSLHLPNIAIPYYGSSPLPPVPPTTSSSGLAGSNGELDTLRAEREAEQKHIQDLGAELRGLQVIQNNQAHPRNLVIVKNIGTPVLAQPAERSHVLFAAADRDEFEFLNMVGEWVHVSISGVSRGYIRRSNLTLPEFIAEDQAMPNQTASRELRGAFRMEREETSIFPGDWEPLRGKPVKIYTVRPASQDVKETNAQAKFDFALSLFRKFSTESARDAFKAEGAVIIFDSADGGIIGSTTRNVRQMAAGSLSESDFRANCFFDPPDISQNKTKQ